jgi:uncharacterized protein (TIRG00374 family)
VKKHLKSVVRIAVSAVLLGLLAWRMDWEKIRLTFAQTRVEYWLAATGVFLIAQVASSIRWRWLARPLGFEQGSGRFLGYYFVGMFFNLVLPTSVGGDVVRAWYLDGHSGRRVPAFVSVFADRVSGLLVLLTLACLGVALSPMELDPRVQWSVLGMAGGALMGMAGFGMLVLWKRESIKAWGQGRRKERAEPATWLGRQIGRLRHFTLAFSHTLALYTRFPGMIIVTTVLSLVVQAANVLMVVLLGEAIGAPVPIAYYWILVPVVSLLGVLIPSIGGMGVREWGSVLFLAPLGVEERVAIPLGFLWTLAQSAANFTGLFFYLFGRFERLRQAREGEEGDLFVDENGSNREVRSDDRFIRDCPDQGRARQSAAVT